MLEVAYSALIFDSLKEKILSLVRHYYFCCHTIRYFCLGLLDASSLLLAQLYHRILVRKFRSFPLCSSSLEWQRLCYQNFIPHLPLWCIIWNSLLYFLVHFGTHHIPKHQALSFYIHLLLLFSTLHLSSNRYIRHQDLLTIMLTRLFQPRKVPQVIHSSRLWRPRHQGNELLTCGACILSSLLT